MLPLHRTQETFPEQLELFERPTVQNAIEASFYSSLTPLSTNLNGEQLEFLYTSSEHFIDPSDIFLYIKCRIEEDGTSSVSKPIAGPVNCFFYMLFERLELELNGVPIDAGFNNLPYKGYYKTIFREQNEQRRGSARGILFEPDILRHFDDADCGIDGANSGLKKRTIFTRDFKDSTSKPREFELFGRPMHEFFYMRNYLLPRITMRIKLHRKQPAFSLMSESAPAKFKITITDAFLKIRHVKIDGKTAAQIEKTIAAKSPACYVMPNCIEVKDRQLSPNARVYAIDNFFASERLPSRVTFALVRHAAFVGALDRNPLNFETHNLEEITLTVDNQTERYTIDKANEQYVQLYDAITADLTHPEEGKLLELPYADILEGYAFYPFELYPCRTTCDLMVPRQKNVRLELKFSTTLTESLTLLCFIEHSHIYHIDKNRVVTKVF